MKASQPPQVPPKLKEGAKLTEYPDFFSIKYNDRISYFPKPNDPVPLGELITHFAPWALEKK